MQYIEIGVTFFLYCFIQKLNYKVFDLDWLFITTSDHVRGLWCLWYIILLWNCNIVQMWFISSDYVSYFQNNMFMLKIHFFSQVQWLITVGMKEKRWQDLGWTVPWQVHSHWASVLTTSCLLVWCVHQLVLAIQLLLASGFQVNQVMSFWNIIQPSMWLNCLIKMSMLPGFTPMCLSFYTRKSWEILTE